MEPELKPEFLRAIFLFKNLMNTRFSGAGKQKFSLNEIMLLRGLTAGKSLNQIQEELAVTRSAISQNLTALEKKGAITRETDLADRRQIIIKLTKAGSIDFATAETEFDAGFEQFVSQMGTDQLQQLISLMTTMIQLLGN